MNKVLFEAEGTSRGDRVDPENVAAAAPFPARVTCSDSEGGLVLAGMVEGSMDSCPH